jgi:hypothetical protein
MQLPSIARGYFYPTNLKNRCPRFSRCTVSNKCQNYDKHVLMCNVCESRVRPAQQLGGYLAEGEFQPDIQKAIKVIQKALNNPFSHPDATPTSMGMSPGDYKEYQESVEVLKQWGGRVTEEDVYMELSDVDKAKLNGLL